MFYNILTVLEENTGTIFMDKSECEVGATIKD